MNSGQSLPSLVLPLAGAGGHAALVGRVRGDKSFDEVVGMDETVDKGCEAENKCGERGENNPAPAQSSARREAHVFLAPISARSLGPGRLREQALCQQVLCQQCL